MTPENCRKVKAMRAELDALRAKHRAVKEKDPCAAERWHKMILRRWGCLDALMAEIAAPGDPLDWWCVWCERVSVQPRPLEGVRRCHYPDCSDRNRFEQLRRFQFGPVEIGDGYRYNNGRSWFVIRRNLHPEYPETAEPGRCYPVPEITPDIRKLPKLRPKTSQDTDMET